MIHRKRASIAVAILLLWPEFSHFYWGSGRVENVPHYAQVEAPQAYRLIDVVYFGSGRSLESDFIVQSGALCRYPARAAGSLQS